MSELAVLLSPEGGVPDEVLLDLGAIVILGSGRPAASLSPREKAVLESLAKRLPQGTKRDGKSIAQAIAKHFERSPLPKSVLSAVDRALRELLLDGAARPASTKSAAPNAKTGMKAGGSPLLRFMAGAMRPARKKGGR